MKSSFNEAVLRSLIMISNACMVLDILDVINAVPLSCGVHVRKCQVVSRRTGCMYFFVSCYHSWRTSPWVLLS